MAASAPPRLLHPRCRGAAKCGWAGWFGRGASRSPHKCCPVLPFPRATLAKRMSSNVCPSGLARYLFARPCMLHTILLQRM